MRTWVAITLIFAAFAAPVAAQDGGQNGATAYALPTVHTLGVGRIFNNDYLGDTQDRWRTGSYAISIVRGAGWDGELPSMPGQIIEYRLRSEVIAPMKLNGPDSKDRPYVGAYSAGIHTHFAFGPTDISLGADLTATGPSTGISTGHQAFHDSYFSLPSLGRFVIDNQLGDAVYASATVELSWPLHIAPQATLRPFLEAQTGVEEIARLGFDVVLGRVGQQDLFLRDVPTGQLYRGISSPELGLGYVFGLDFALVGGSVYLPEDFGTTPTDSRTRARAGVHWQFGEEQSMFYGLTWLSEEYVGQPEGQMVGSLKLNFNF